MFSYVGITSICTVDIRRKQSFDRSVTRLEFMAAVWGEDEDSHATLLPVWTNANHGCLATELLVSVSKDWHVLQSALHISQNDPPRSIRMDLVMNVFNLPCVQ